MDAYAFASMVVGFSLSYSQINWGQICSKKICFRRTWMGEKKKRSTL